MKKYYGDSYFKTFVEYSFALMNENSGRHKNYLAKKYLFDRPLAYSNYEYMETLNELAEVHKGNSL